MKEIVVRLGCYEGIRGNEVNALLESLRQVKEDNPCVSEIKVQIGDREVVIEDEM